MDAPTISVVMPLYNAASHLRETLESLFAQDFEDFELIAINDGSKDETLEILGEFASKDARIVIVDQDNAGSGATRNRGLQLAKGDFLIFLDGDDIFSPKLLSTAYETITGGEAHRGEPGWPADIAAFNFSQFDNDGNELKRVGVHTEWLPSSFLMTGQRHFSYKDCPDGIMGIVNPTVWTRLYRREFLIEHELLFDEISSVEDISFCAVSVACAARVAYTEQSLLKYRRGQDSSLSRRKDAQLANALHAVKSAVSQASRLPYASEISEAIRRFAIDNLLTAYKRSEHDFEDSDMREYYEQVHALFHEPDYASLELDDFAKYPHLFRGFDTIRRHSYEKMAQLRSRRLIVSLTSYPARIAFVGEALKSVLAQTRPADLVVLYLADCQFPNGDADLPEELLEMQRRGDIEIRWCKGDLGPHKKYFYALREFAEDVVVTVDDDLVYGPHVLEHLWDSYLQFPEAVSAMRAHLIVIGENGEPLPYAEWILKCDLAVQMPSMQFLAVGCGGVLYPPGATEFDLFDEEAIRKTCLFSDDLWLKVMEMAAGTPVVVVQEDAGLHYVEGSQEEALYHRNLNGGGNDRQLRAIREWLASTKRGDVFIECLSGHACDIGGIHGIRLYTHLYAKRMQALQQKLQRTYAEKSEINAKLQRTYNEKSEINAKLQRTYKEKSERGIAIRELEKERDTLKKKLAKLRKENQALHEQVDSLQAKPETPEPEKPSKSFKAWQKIVPAFRKDSRQ